MSLVRDGFRDGDVEVFDGNRLGHDRFFRYSCGMRLPIRVTPRAKKPGIKTAEDGTLAVRVREPAEDGRANDAVVAALADHFGVAKRAVTIVHGHGSRRKFVEVQQ